MSLGGSGTDPTAQPPPPPLILPVKVLAKAPKDVSHSCGRESMARWLRRAGMWQLSIAVNQEAQAGRAVTFEVYLPTHSVQVDPTCSGVHIHVTA